MPDPESVWDSIGAELERKDAAREESLSQARKVVRLCADSIRHVHRQEFAAAEALMDEAAGVLRGLQPVRQEHPDVYYAGFIQDAEKEYAEARITLAMAREQRIPSPVELEVEAAPYLNGAAEAIGEVRRRIVDLLRTGGVTRCAALLEVMDDLYTGIVSFDYPDALLAGLRRRTDMARSIIERTRQDVTTALRQEKLEGQMKALQEGLARAGVPVEELE